MTSTHRQIPYLRKASSLLWIDCLGGLAVGVIVLALSPWLSRLYAMPESFVIALGSANLAYGAVSPSCSWRARTSGASASSNGAFSMPC